MLGLPYAVPAWLVSVEATLYETTVHPPHDAGAVTRHVTPDPYKRTDLIHSSALRQSNQLSAGRIAVPRLRFRYCCPKDGTVARVGGIPLQLILQSISVGDLTLQRTKYPYREVINLQLRPYHKQLCLNKMASLERLPPIQIASKLTDQLCQ